MGKDKEGKMNNISDVHDENRKLRLENAAMRQVIIELLSLIRDDGMYGSFLEENFITDDEQTMEKVSRVMDYVSMADSLVELNTWSTSEYYGEKFRQFMRDFKNVWTSC